MFHCASLPTAPPDDPTLLVNRMPSNIGQTTRGSARATDSTLITAIQLQRTPPCFLSTICYRRRCGGSSLF
ncbi:protein of unknown function (plasmid) [Methylocella tundrae]|uniref:Uncharacterized protein n=1 Tax=Methylocella tundrae TaxID=227605 RepID=A0A4U8Z6P0_METTU|nr:protein of unknown function [Methylocella tundrae]